MVARAAQAPGQGLARYTGEAAPVSAGLGILLLVFVIAFWPTITWMASEWSSSAGSLSHGYLVAAISAFLFVRAIPEVASIGASPAWWLLPFVFGLSLVWLLGNIATVIAVETLVLPALLLLAVAAAFGLRAARPLVFPILYFYFAVPAWDHLQFVFQAITVAVVGALIRLSGIPALLDGNFVYLADGAFEIAGGCAGLAFVIAGLSLAALYGYLFYAQLRHTLILAAVALAVAMVGNWIRVFVIILIGHNTQMESGLVDDHLTFGWVIFSVLMIPVYWLARRLEDRDIGEPVQSSDNTPSARPGTKAAFLAAAAAMVVGPAWALQVHQSVAGEGDLILVLPKSDGRWPGPADSQWDWQPRFSGPDAERVAQYGDGEDFVLAYTNVYLSQEQDRELVYFSNRVEGDWQGSRPSAADQSINLGNGLIFRQRMARNYVGDWVIWSRYQVGERFEETDIGAKLAQAIETLKGRPESGVIAFATRCNVECEAATARLTAFVQDVGGSIEVSYSREEQ